MSSIASEKLISRPGCKDSDGEESFEETLTYQNKNQIKFTNLPLVLYYTSSS